MTREWPNGEEVRAMLATPDRRSLRGKRDYAALRTMAEGGPRESELCALNVADLKDVNDRPCLAVKCLKKRGRTVMRTIPLSNETAGAIRSYIRAEYGKQPDPDAPMFRTLGTRGFKVKGRLSPKAVDIIVARAVSAAGIVKHITPHGLRHACASLMVQTGTDIVTIQEVLGHSSPATTAIYLHSSLERKAAGVDRLAALWGGESLEPSPSAAIPTGKARVSPARTGRKSVAAKVPPMGGEVPSVTPIAT